MAQTVDSAIIKETQDLLGKYVTTPNLTDKLLNKPPFKFLHDVITAVIRETGYLDGLYSDEELSKDNIKDREAKISFLQKCIDATVLSTGEELTVRPSKIVSGHEADKTNELLQAIAKAIDGKVESKEAVQKVLSGGKPSKSKGPKDKSSKSSDKPKTRSRDDKSKARVKPGSKDDSKKPSRVRDRKERDPKRRDSKSEDKSKRGVRAGKENAPPAAADPEPEPEETPPETPKPEAVEEAPADEPEEAPPLFNGDDEDQPASSSPVMAEEIMVPPEQESVVDEEAPGEGAPDEGASVLPEDQGIGSGGPGSLVMEGVGAGDELPEPPPTAEIDPAILKAMDPQGDLADVPEGDNHNPLLNPQLMITYNPDSGVGSIDSPKRSTPTDSPDNDDGSNGLEQPEDSDNRRGGPMKAVHPLPGDEMDLPSTGVSSPPVGPAGVPSRPPTSQGFSSSRPVSARSARPRTARPPSARPAAPRVRERKEPDPEEASRPPTAKPNGAMTALILESSKSPRRGDDDDIGGVDDEFLVGDQQSGPLANDPLGLAGDFMSGLPGADDDVEAGEGGILMDQIMDVKKNLEDGREAAFSPETPGHRRVDLGGDGLSDAHRRKERELIQQDVSKLAASIQTLTKAVNPLAKMLDYLQEDLDSMQKELETWRQENKKLRQTLRSEQGNMSNSIKPLEVELNNLTAAILEQQDKISIVKCSTLKNAAKINTLLSAVSISSE